MAQPRKNFEAAVQMYQSGLSLAEIARVLGVTRQAMWDVLRRRGVQLRPQKRFGEDNTFHRGGRIHGKKQARTAMQTATDKGEIKRGTACEQCHAVGFVEGHHDDYNHPLAVRWLCKLCHFEWHKMNKAVALYE